MVKNIEFDGFPYECSVNSEYILYVHLECFENYACKVLI